MNPWIIDVDHIADPRAMPRSNQNAVGVRGPHNYSGDGKELRCEFQMFDDDGVLYYSGRSANVGFEPLDDFGTPNAGATSIKFLNCDTEEWEVL